jgi:hypothetical protein
VQGTFQSPGHAGLGTTALESAVHRQAGKPALRDYFVTGTARSAYNRFLQTGNLRRRLLQGIECIDASGVAMAARRQFLRLCVSSGVVITQRRKGAGRQRQNRNRSAGLTAEARRTQRRTDRNLVFGHPLVLGPNHTWVEIPVLSSCWLVPLIIIEIEAVLSPVLFTGEPGAWQRGRFSMSLVFCVIHRQSQQSQQVPLRSAGGLLPHGAGYKANASQIWRSGEPTPFRPLFNDPFPKYKKRFPIT